MAKLFDKNKGRISRRSFLRIGTGVLAGTLALGAARTPFLSLQPRYGSAVRAVTRATLLALSPRERTVEEDTDEIVESRLFRPSLDMLLFKQRAAETVKPFFMGARIGVKKPDLSTLPHELVHLFPELYGRKINHFFLSKVAEDMMRDLTELIYAHKNEKQGSVVLPGFAPRPYSFNFVRVLRKPDGWWTLLISREGKLYKVVRTDRRITVTPNPVGSRELWYGFDLSKLERYAISPTKDALELSRRTHDGPIEGNSEPEEVGMDLANLARTIGYLTGRPGASATVLRGVAVEGLSLQDAEWRALSGVNRRREEAIEQAVSKALESINNLKD